MTYLRRHWIAALALVLAGNAPATASAASTLPAMQAMPGHTSVSGLSSGAFMAVQYGVAFSSDVIGIGVVAGGPYNCSWVNLGGIVTCMSGAPLGAASFAAAQGFAALGQIDPVAGLAKMKVYVFSGSKDSVVRPAVVKATRDFFADAGVTPPNLAYVNDMAAGHAFIAPGFGNICGTNADPYIDQCKTKGRNYDQPQAILQHIYGPLKPAVASLSKTVVPFDQREFASASSGLDDIGFVYIPQACSVNAGSCAVHVVFHGCLQGARSVGSNVYSSVGYNRWADSNNLIVLYPQVAATKFLPTNPQGCWDWFGYAGTNFQVKSGVQMAAVKAMVDRLTLEH
jgi:poly(3-hydroxybutyrate) depolymerase